VSMFDIKKAAPRETAEFKFYRLSPDPKKPITLHVRHMGSTNAAYVNAVFTRTAPDAPDTETAHARLTRMREQEMADIAAFVVASWDGVMNDGKPVECTPETVLAFLKFALANGYVDEIDSLRAFAPVLANFREPIAKADDLGKG